MNIHRRIVNVTMLLMVVAAVTVSPAAPSFAAHTSAVALTAKRVMAPVASSDGQFYQDNTEIAAADSVLAATPPKPMYDPVAKANAATANPNAVIINENVQTQDVFSPNPGFLPPTVPAGTLNPPDVTLDATNQTPFWTSDDQYILFSSNRDSTVDTDPKGNYHLWIVPSAGGIPIQLTSGAGNEKFPIVSPQGDQIAFTSDVAGTGQQLYVTTFNEPLAGEATPTPIDVSTLTSYTIVDTGSEGFSEVGRPAWSSDESKIAFAALSIPTEDRYSPSVAHWHIYFMYVATHGYLSSNHNNLPNPPGQLTDGPEDDIGAAWSPDGNYIAFSSNAEGGFTSNTNGILPNPTDPSTSSIPTVASNSYGSEESGGTYLRDPEDGIVVDGVATEGMYIPIQSSIYILNAADGTIVGNTAGGLLTTSNTGQVDRDPAWSSATFVLPGVNQPVPTLLAFDRQQASGIADINYFRAIANGSIQAETVPGTTALNTSQPGTVYSQQGTPSSDRYPTFSAFQVTNSIGYQSHRSITYNNPANADPVEVPFSLPPGTVAGVNGATAAVAAGYEGILQSEVADLTPPTLLPFAPGNNDNIVNVTLEGVATPTHQFSAGDAVTFSVRLSSREAGIDPNNIYIQIKDPENFYEDPNHVEHKLLATDNIPNNSSGADDTDLQDIYAFPPGYAAPFTPVVVGTNAQLYLGIVDLGWVNNDNVYYYVRGAIGAGGSPAPWGVGRSDYNWPSPLSPTNAESMSTNSALSEQEFQSWGPEYESQYLNANYIAPNINDPDDFGRPYYLAGFDDRVPGSGPPARPEWLKLTAAAVQDNLGGEVFTANWQTPSNLPSDFIIDVIAYDKNQIAGITSPNWRIYDNIWGFTTQPFVEGQSSVLFVSDYGSGQKFGVSDYRGASNLRPVFYGSESYFTGRDPKKLPTVLDIYQAAPMNIAGGTKQFKADIYTINQLYDADDPAYPLPTGIGPVMNTLGPYSYDDDIINPGYAINAPQYKLGTSPPAQQYAIWRILCRGPVPTQLYIDYGAKPSGETQPAVVDSARNVNDPAATFTVATKCIVWSSPFAGYLFTGPGTITDSNTISNLETFLGSGGRLFLSGSSVVSAIANDVTGTVNGADFLQTYLGVSSPGIGGAAATLAGTAGGRIAGDGILGGTNSVFGGAGTGLGTQLAKGSNFYFITAAFLTTYAPPSSRSLYLTDDNANYPVRDFPAIERSDASEDQFTSFRQEFSPGVGVGDNDVVGSIDYVKPLSTATTEYTAGGKPALTRYENPTNEETAPQSISRAVLASFGFEAVGIDYYSDTPPNSFPYYLPYNARPRIMHNILDYLRTGSLTGSIKVNGVSPPSGPVVVYAESIGGQIPDMPEVNVNGTPVARTVYSATTNSDGQYQIDGMESGIYQVYVTAPGYSVAPGSNGWVQVEGDATSQQSLVITQLPAATITGSVTSGTATGPPVNGATVTFTATDGSNVTATATTNANGVYTMTINAAPLPGTPLSGVASFGTSTSAPPLTLTAVQGGTYTGENFVLPVTPGEITGTVVIAGTTTGIGGATVTAVSQSGGSPITVTTNTTNTATGLIGQFTIPVPLSNTPVNYAVTANAAGYEPSAAVLAQGVANGLITSVGNIPLTPGSPGYAGGLIVGATGGLPVAGVSVAVTQAGTAVTSFGSSSTATSPPIFDGKQVNFSGALAVGAYTLTPTLSGATISPVSETVTVTAGTGVTPSQVTVVKGTAANFVVSGTAVIKGLVTAGPYSPAVAGATVTVTTGTGATLTTVATVITNSNTTGENYAVEILPAAGAAGTTYSVSIAKTGLASPAPSSVTLIAGQTVNLNLSFLPVNSFTAGIDMISVPSDYSGDTWQQVIGPGPGSSASDTWTNLFAWNATSELWTAYPTAPANAPQLGVGYFVRFPNGFDVQLVGTPPAATSVSVPLEMGWNLIGVPSSTPINLTSLSFVNQSNPASPITWTVATGSGFNLVSPTLYWWNPADTTQSASGSYDTDTAQLQPWFGYWIYANFASTIIIPTSGE